MDSYMLEPDRVTRIDDEPGPQLEPDADPKLHPKHKIFFSHSSAQKDFVEQLCVDLESLHHPPFLDKRDDSLPKGERFPNLIFQAAKHCRVAVVVLSEEFFTRTKWPMLELDALVKVQQECDGYRRILPLFFKLTCAQCRESARRERWLEVWQGWAQGDSRIVIDDWVDALNVLGTINGLEYQGEGDVHYRKTAQSAIIGLVPPHLQFDTTSLEGSERLCKVILDKFHEVEASTKYEVRVVGVYGMGGLGKTTVCKALCYTQFAEYDGRVCLVELGSLSREELQRHVLRELNPMLMDDLGGDKVVQLLKERMHKHKVFLALDNVWDTLDSREAAMTILQAGFHCDSMVLVTARSRDVLLGMNIDASNCIQMPELDKEEATKLFLHHAIPHRLQLESIERDVVKQFVERCQFGKGGGSGTSSLQYLPLAIKVLACHLGASSDDPLDWERISNLIYYPSYDIVPPVSSILRTGFDSLSQAQQLLFMDVALFCANPNALGAHFGLGDPFPGNIFYWLSLLHNTSPGETIYNLQILKRKSLLEDLGDGLSRITLHNLYFEFAVSESQAMDFSQRRWLFADYKTLSKITGKVFLSTTGIPEVLQQKPRLSCWLALKRIAICNSKLQSLGRSELQYCSNVVLLKLVDCPDLESVDLHDLGRLKFLEVDGCWKLKASSSRVEDMTKLVWLRWRVSFLDFPAFPNLSLLKSLRVLELLGDTFEGGRDSKLSRLPGLEDCVNLVELSLVGHSELLAFPDLSRMVFLEKVRFGWCKKASGLRGLSSKMTQLQELLLIGCEGIVELPGVEDLVRLKKFQVQSCGVMELFPHLKKPTYLEENFSDENLEFSATEWASIGLDGPDSKDLTFKCNLVEPIRTKHCSISPMDDQAGPTVPPDNASAHTLASNLQPSHETLIGIGVAMRKLNLYLGHGEDCVAAMQSVLSHKFNYGQCEYLADKLQMVVWSARLYLNALQGDLGSYVDIAKVVEVFKFLLALAKQVKSFVHGCCKDSWIQSAMTLTNVWEFVASVGFNLELCRVAFCMECAATACLTLKEVEEIHKVEVEVVKKKAFSDVDALTQKIIVEGPSFSKKDKDLAFYLLQRLNQVKPIPGAICKFSEGSFGYDGGWFGRLFEWVKPSGQLGRGASGSVDNAMWLGTPVAKKTFYGKDNPVFITEVEALSPLSHPNVMSIFCSGMNQRGCCSIIMELMDEDLSKLMERSLEEKSSPSSDSCPSPFPILEAVDIMLQIGEGGKYLHDQGIAHRDLKSMNILAKNLSGEDLDGYVHVKVADFGLSKTKEKSTRFSTMSYNVGTSRWMAPEIIRFPKSDQGSSSRIEGPKHPLKRDVYSFGMVCFEILTGDIPFASVHNEKDVKRQVIQGKRPELPKDPQKCPPLLKELIESCWSPNPHERPTFITICSALKDLKYLLMRSYCLGQTIKKAAQQSRPNRVDISDSMEQLSDNISSRR